MLFLDYQFYAVKLHLLSTLIILCRNLSKLIKSLQHCGEFNIFVKTTSPHKERGYHNTCSQLLPLPSQWMSISELELQRKCHGKYIVFNLIFLKKAGSTAVRTAAGHIPIQAEYRVR